MGTICGFSDEQAIEPAQAPKKRELSDFESKILDRIVNKQVEEIWGKFDDDGNGILDVEEARKFFKHYLDEMGEDGSALTDEQFKDTFEQFDDDKSGTIDKEEMS